VTYLFHDQQNVVSTEQGNYRKDWVDVINRKMTQY